MAKDYNEILEELKESLSECNDFYSQQYKHSRDLLEFWSGDQFTDQEINDRRINMRPTLEALNVCRPYINSIVNPFRSNPNGIKINIDDSEKSRIVNGLIGYIEYKSNADEAYETAFENAVVGGLGWVVLTNDYESNESLNQIIKICRVEDPESVMIDPNSKSIVGDDAQYAIVLNYVSEEIIEDTYGEEYCDYKNGINVYKNWIIPKSAIPVITYYVKKHKMVKRWFFADGTYTDSYEKPTIPTVAKRDIKQTYVEVYKIIGNKVVDVTKLDIECIPVVPFYGDRVVNRNDMVKWTGAIEWMKAPQRMINTYFNSEKEMVNNAPISPWIATAEQIDGYEKYWRNSNKTAWDTLLYNSVEGQAAPSRVDNNANIAPAITGRQNAMQDLQRTVGIFDPQLGNQQSGSEQSGIALSIRDSFGNRTNAHYYQNAAKSIAQVGKVLIQLLKSTYEGEMKLKIKDQFYGITEEEVNTAEMLSGIDMSEIEVSVGAMIQSKKEQETGALLAIQNLLPEDKKLALIDILADRIETKNKRVVMDRVKKLVPVEFKDAEENAPDPQAMAALQAAEETINKYKEQEELMAQYITQLQNQLAIIENDSKSMLEKAILDNRTKIEVEAMKQEGLNQRELAKILAESEDRMTARIDKFFASLKPLIQSENFEVKNIKSKLDGKQFDKVEYTTDSIE